MAKSKEKPTQEPIFAPPTVKTPILPTKVPSPAVVNRSPQAVPPTSANFWWLQTGKPIEESFDGNSFNYPTTPLNEQITFTAVSEGKTPQEEAEAGHYYVITPAGVTILEYIWNFGDGIVGYGPIVTHTYTVNDPNTTISLVVVDSLRRRSSISKPLNLISDAFGHPHGYHIRALCVWGGTIYVKEVLVEATRQAEREKKPLPDVSHTEDKITQVTVSHTGTTKLKTTVTATDKSETSDSMMRRLSV